MVSNHLLRAICIGGGGGGGGGAVVDLEEAMPPPPPPLDSQPIAGSQSAVNRMQQIPDPSISRSI